NDFHPYIYKTTDYGSSWIPINSNIPASVFSSVHVVREDPVRPGLLYAGTENGVYVSFDDGSRWLPLQTNLPHAPVHWLTIQPHFNDLVVGTYGRGFWILDDITPLQKINSEVLDMTVHLFEPRPTYRFRTRESTMNQPEDSGAGTNPSYGAGLHYYLPNGLGDDENLHITILDADGKVVRSLSGLPSAAGINRVHWDLRYDRTDEPQLRMPAFEHSHVRADSDRGLRPVGDGSRVAILAPPGLYTVRLTLGDTELIQSLTVLKDPHSAGSEEDIAAQMALLVDLREILNDAVLLINEIESVREQIADISRRMREQPENDLIIDAVRSLDEQLLAIEMKLSDQRLSGGSARQDSIRWPRQLLAKLSSLAGYVGQTDFPPTTQQLEVLENYKELLDTYKLQMDGVRNGTLVEFNQALVEQGLVGVVPLP
ncbi:MAG: hypothetical protein CL480_00005, partial [Acidobacteria bacterium]|nr:hypothetical protein [Acidobacteriota bacterium]